MTPGNPRLAQDPITLIPGEQDKQYSYAELPRQQSPEAQAGLSPPLHRPKQQKDRSTIPDRPSSTLDGRPIDQAMI